jgi:hypothetical protein
MTTLSSAGWVIHDIGLATTIGGTMFGQIALEPALEEISNPRQRDLASEKAWNRFSWVKLAGHVAFAVPWLIGRSMLSGREVSTRARALTRTKDILVGASLITGVSSFVIGKVLGKQAREGVGPEQARAGNGEQSSRALEGAEWVLGGLNLIATTGVLAVTALLAMEGSESVKFSVRSRKLP